MLPDQKDHQDLIFLHSFSIDFHLILVFITHQRGGNLLNLLHLDWRLVKEAN